MIAVMPETGVKSPVEVFKLRTVAPPNKREVFIGLTAGAAAVGASACACKLLEGVAISKIASEATEEPTEAKGDFMFGIGRAEAVAPALLNNHKKFLLLALLANN